MKTRIFGAAGYAPVAFEPGGRGWSRSGEGQGGTLRFWDAATGQPLNRRIDLGEHPIHWLSYSPDGRLLQITEQGGVVRLWDAATDRPLTYPFLRIPNHLKTGFHPSGRALLAAPYEGEGRARLVAIPEGIESATAVAPGSPRPIVRVADRPDGVGQTVAVDPGGNRLVAAGKTIRIIDLENGDAVGPPIRSRWQSPGPVAIGRDGTTIAHVANNTYGQSPGTLDCLVEVRDLATGRPRGSPLHPRNTVIALDVSPDGRSIATGDFSDLVQIWDAATGDPIGPPIVQENIVWSIAYSPDGTRLAVGTHRQRAEGHAGVRIWDLAHRRPLGPAARHRPASDAETLLWSGDGSRVTSLSRDARELMLIDGRTGEVVARAADFADLPTVMIASPDGSSLLLGTAEGTVEMRDSMNLNAIGRTMSPPDTLLLRRRVIALAVSPDGLTIAAGHVDGSIRLWDVATREPIGPPLCHDRSIIALVFRQGGRTLSSTSLDGEVRTWPVRDAWDGPAGQLTLRLEVDTGMALGPRQDVMILPPDVLDRKARELAERCAPARSIAVPQDDPGRHERDARRAEHRALWFTALFHLDHLIAHRPEDGPLRVRRAMALAAEGRTDEAQAELSRALEAGPREACVDLLVQRGTRRTRRRPPGPGQLGFQPGHRGSARRLVALRRPGRRERATWRSRRPRKGPTYSRREGCRQPLPFPAREQARGIGTPRSSDRVPRPGCRSGRWSRGPEPLDVAGAGPRTPGPPRPGGRPEWPCRGCRAGQSRPSELLACLVSARPRRSGRVPLTMRRKPRTTRGGQPAASRQ